MNRKRFIRLAMSYRISPRLARRLADVVRRAGQSYLYGYCMMHRIFPLMAMCEQSGGTVNIEFETK